MSHGLQSDPVKEARDLSPGPDHGEAIDLSTSRRKELGEGQAHEEQAQSQLEQGEAGMGGTRDLIHGRRMA